MNIKKINKDKNKKLRLLKRIQLQNYYNNPKPILQKEPIKKLNYNYSSLQFIGQPFIWNNKENQKPIELTVAIPLYKTEKIIPIVLESLKNQQNITFAWEIILYEEYGNSLNIIKSYIDNLPGCVKIIYRKIKSPIPISTKWFGMIKDTSESSKVFVIQSSDDYSPSLRLYIHYKHFQNETCDLSCQRNGIFINLINKRQIIYNGINTFLHLNPAMKTEDVRKMNDMRLKKYIHSFMINELKRINKKSPIILYSENIDNNNWKTGFFTDGFNALSLSRKNMYSNPSTPFKKSNLNLFKLLPENVFEMIKKLK